MSRIVFVFAFVLLLLFQGGSVAQTPAVPVLTVVPDHPDGCYALEEKVVWTIDVQSGSRAELTSIPYEVKRDGKETIAQGVIDLSVGSATLTASRGEPGTLLAVIGLPDKVTRKPLALGGAAFGREKIGPSSPAPDDFDDFWRAKLEELAAVPANPVVEPVAVDGLKYAEGVDYYKITLDNIRSTHVRGQLARPKTGEKFPAMLMLQYAGIYPLEKRSVIDQAKAGWLALNIEAHDIPIDAASEVYEKLDKGDLQSYALIGCEDRDTSYFVRMITGCVRAAEYLATRPDWDGRLLVAMGTSQGGLQAFATAALFPKITQVMVLVPAGCDTDGPNATPARAISWPYWLFGSPQKDIVKIRRTARYFDTISFAARSHCPALVGVGLLDETARPTGVIAAYNAVPVPEKEKELVVLPSSNHRGSGGTQSLYAARFKAWRDALRSGAAPLPPEKGAESSASAISSAAAFSPVGN